MFCNREDCRTKQTRREPRPPRGAVFAFVMQPSRWRVHSGRVQASCGCREAAAAAAPPPPPPPPPAPPPVAPAKTDTMKSRASAGEASLVDELRVVLPQLTQRRKLLEFKKTPDCFIHQVPPSTTTTRVTCFLFTRLQEVVLL
ncbi:hypothetical protein MSG28_011330 [Choristoneura fumiferana]|uniref:Uncharacterized protein n=1 Tax=Choristoneura fumiferana TaxID=7141 RepID=A0ACC0JN46_CHOFU|nr:hypothetical protein MSG28_011330 [Choristoneura fumiferana]